METEQSVLQRKVSQGGATVPAEHRASEQCWRQAVAKGALGEGGLVAGLLEVTRGCHPRDELGATVPDNAVMMLLQGADDSMALAWVDPPALTAMVEMATTGHVSAAAPEERAPTRTDAAIAANVIDRILAHYDGLMQEATGAKPPSFRYSDHLEEARAIALTLADVSHEMHLLHLDLGRGARQGKIGLCLPPPAKPEATPLCAAQWQRAMEEVVGHADVRLEAVMARVSLPLGSLSQKKPGDLIFLPSEAITHTHLCDADGKTVHLGRLGQSGGYRAVKLVPPPEREDDEFAEAAAAAGDALALPNESLDLGGLDTEALDLGGSGDLAEQAIDTLGDLNAVGTGDSLANLGNDLPDLGDLGSITDDAELPDLGGLGDDAAGEFGAELSATGESAIETDLGDLAALSLDDPAAPDAMSADLPDLGDLSSATPEDLPDLGDLGTGDIETSLDDLPDLSALGDETSPD